MDKIFFKKGESVTIGFLLNSDYDMARIQSASAWVGGKKFDLATNDHMLRCELASDDTHNLSGSYKLMLWIDDVNLGVKKTHVADVEISQNNSNDNNTSINTGYDFVFSVVINDISLVLGGVVYNYVKGDKGDKGDTGDPAILPNDIVIDANYVHTDNNYDDAAVEEVAKIAGKQDKTDNSLETDDKTVVGAINEVNSIAKGANQSLAFDNYQAVIAAMLISGLNEGQNLYVDTLDVPDLWVKSVELTSTAYTHTTDEQFVTDILAGVQIGYYKLALLETQKVYLTNYYTKSESDFNYEPKNSNIQTHIGTTGNPHSTAIDDMTSGAATTVGSGDSFFIKVGNLWKTITEAHWLTWFRGLPHTWSLIQDFAAGLKTDSITKRNGSGLYKLQDDGTEWYSGNDSRWFTPTGTFSSVGTAVTTTGGQLTASMVGSKIGVGEDKRVMTVFINSNQCTVDSAYSQDYSSAASGTWGVWNLKFQSIVNNRGISFYTRDSRVEAFGFNWFTGIASCNGLAVSNGLLDLAGNGTVKLRNYGSRLAGFDDGTIGNLIDLKLRSLYAAKNRTTEEGGVCVLLTNKTGAASVKGTVVYSSPTTDNAFTTNPVNGDMPFGIVYENGIADGSECWVVVSGIAEVLMENSESATRSYIAYSSATTAGRIQVSATVPASATHFREIGHTLESKTAGTNVLVKCVLHFN